MFNRNVFLALLVVGGACRAQTPDLADARVSIPYPELKKLWEAAHPAKPEEKPAPVEAAVLSAKTQLAITNESANGSVVIECESFRNGWTSLPLAGSALQIERIEPADASVMLLDGKWTLLRSKPGRSTLTLHFATPLLDVESMRGFRVPSVEAPVKTLVVTSIPEGQEIEVTGATRIGTKATPSIFRLPAGAPFIGIALRHAAEPPSPSRWRIDSVVAAEFKDNTLTCEAHIAAHATDGSGLDLELLLPPGASDAVVKTDDLKRWTGGREIHIEWRTRDLLNREFTVCYKVPCPATAGEWRLAAPKLKGADDAPALFAVAGEPGMEFKSLASFEVAPPRWLAERITQRNFTLVGADGRVAVRWLPLAPTTPAVVEKAQATTRIVTDGALLSEAGYVIRHERPLVWRLHLPEKTELLNCLVNGRAVSPVARGENIIEFTLDAPTGQARTEIKVSYTGRKPAFHPVEGRVEVELPQTELLINRLDWTLQIPAAYALVALEGNVESAPSNRADGIALCKELCRNERPAARLFYQKPEAKKP
jgi:hypothetical protein